MVLPRMVYISDATELGTIYTKAELAALHEGGGEYGLYLFLDGARMAAALVAEGNDLQPEDFATYCDVFYLGGTKNGLLFGEAVVITNEALKPHFRNMIKQRGGMFAKGFLFGTQFTAYLQDELWLTMARHAVTQAQRIQTAAVQKGYRLFAVSPTNQVFLVLSHAQIERLRQDKATTALCTYMVQLLDENGYLHPEDLADIRQLGIEQTLIDRALSILQSIGWS